MLIIAGLGNPGPKYASNRHNIGFMAADRIHARHHFPPWRKNFQSQVAEGEIAGTRVLLMKPQTFMNESGRAIGEAVRFLKLQPGDVVVLHDELDLAPGKMRVKVGGGHGGHNGLRSISSHISDGYRRIRLGIGHPGVKDLVHGHVLSDFAKADAGWLEPFLDAIADGIDDVVRGDDVGFANRVHLAIAPKPDRVARRPEADVRGAGKAAATSAEAEETAAEPAEPNSMAAILRGLLAGRRRPPRRP
jgi:peptidyl-tRNA hydrolase, PTH1 family